MKLEDILAVYAGSNGDATTALYARLAKMPPRGTVAINLFRACKASARAKVYRGSRYRGAAYDRKNWSIGELCRELVAHADDVGIRWGWGRDPKAVGFENVIYVDVPGAGQVSFHTEHRFDGPDYAGAWDGVRGGAPRRICRWVEAVLDGRDLPTEGEQSDAERQEDRPEGAAAPRDAGEQVQGAGRQEALDL